MTISREKVIKRALTVSLVGNAILAVAKIMTGVFANSLSVLGDGIDSSGDVFISVIALIAAYISSKPSDQDHPYGHGRAETSATTILAFIIFFAGAQLAIKAGKSIFGGAEHNMPDKAALWVTAFSITGKSFLAWLQYHSGKKVCSSILLANAKNMCGDILISASVLFGLFLTGIFHVQLVDFIIALLVGIWVMKSAMQIFKEANDEIMDGKADPALYKAIFEAVNSTYGAFNPHRVRIRRMAAMYDIDLDIEVDGTASVLEAHAIAQKVEQSIKERIDGVYDIVVHIEPKGAGEHVEQYGLNEACFNDD